jgi:putative ABC transport system permease protein
MQNLGMTEGLWFSATQEAAGTTVVVLGDTVAQNLFGNIGIDPLGKKIRIRDQLFRVVGVLTPQGGGQDNVVFVPYRAAQMRLSNDLNGVQGFSEIDVEVDTTDNMSQVQQAATLSLEQHHHIPGGRSDDFQTETSTQILQDNAQASAIFTALFGGIAAISLAVGGIGVMNIMLVSVTQRTREIGVRMAIGAPQSAIRNQFLMEALFLCLFGGFIGLLLGSLLGWLLTRFIGVPFVLSAITISLPFVITTAIGVVFGLYPAIRASHLDPIVAIRSAQ